jgi:hypothetical protein
LVNAGHLQEDLAYIKLRHLGKNGKVVGVTGKEEVFWLIAKDGVSCTLLWQLSLGEAYVLT